MKKVILSLLVILGFQQAKAFQKGDAVLIRQPDLCRQEQDKANCTGRYPEIYREATILGSLGEDTSMDGLYMVGVGPIPRDTLYAIEYRQAVGNEITKRVEVVRSKRLVRSTGCIDNDNYCMADNIITNFNVKGYIYGIKDENTLLILNQSGEVFFTAKKNVLVLNP